MVLTAEDRHWILRGEPFATVLPLLDGNRELFEIASGDGSPSLFELVGVVEELRSIGVLVEGPGGADRSLTGFWDATGPGAEAVLGSLGGAAVSPVAIGESSAPALGPLREALEQLGLRVDAGGVPCVITDDHLNPELEGLNRRYTRAEQPWLLARLGGTRLWLGPCFAPPGTGCWACMSQRLHANRTIERHLRDGESDELLAAPALPALPTTIGAGAALMATELAVLLGGAESQLRGALVTFDLRSLETARHELIRRPQCPVCGDPSLTLRHGPIELKPTAAAVAGLGERSEDLEATLARLDPHVSPLLGSVRAVERLSVPESPLHAYVAGQNRALPSRGLDDAAGGLRARNGGKGPTALSAQVGALCEGIERWCGDYRPEDSLGSRGTLQERREIAISPAELLLFSEQQYDDRTEPQPVGFNQVWERFDPERAIHWAPVWSLTHATRREVPAAFCWYGYPQDEPAFCRADSNGCAAGSSLEEAILQGMLELVERDAIALWWYNRLRKPAVDLGSPDDPYLASVEAWLAASGRDLRVLDLTSDLGIPTFAAVSRRIDADTEEVMLGFGAHLDPSLGITRAVCELGQMLPHLDRWREEEQPEIDDRELARWLVETTVEKEPWLAPDAEARGSLASELPRLASGDLAADVETCLERLHAANLEVLVLDQTRPDVELRVVKVIVPGLRHFWRRLAPGRLYDVPVELGWIERPLQEDELNPWSVFL